MVSFWYEQKPLPRAADGSGIHQFDHSPITDGMWHQLNRNSRSFYRFGRSHFQFVAPENEWSEDENNEVLALIETAGPLHTDDELEILIREEDGAYQMTSECLFRSASASFTMFEPHDWNAAYEKLKELEDGN